MYRLHKSYASYGPIQHPLDKTGLPESIENIGDIDQERLKVYIEQHITFRPNDLVIRVRSAVPEFSVPETVEASAFNSSVTITWRKS